MREAPERDEARMDLIMALICLGYQEKNIKHFERALTFNPDKKTQRYVSLALIRFGLEEGKWEYFEKVLSLDG
jgi:Holliday junction resolvasome RuvABC DNA-binding subunit